jgi:trimethylamine--corrinoid protein Co-methyltransferase
MRFEVLNEKDLELVHEKSLDILSKTGAKVESPKVLEMMAKAGCEVCDEKSIVKFPRRFIEDCLKLAPRKFTLGSLDGKHDMFLGEGNIYVCTDGQGCFAADTDTGKRRLSTMKDLTDAARIADELDYINCFWPIVTANDVPDGTRSLYEIVEIWKVSSKHIHADCFNELQAKYYIEILEEILGSREEVAKRNILSVCYCPMSPMVFEGTMLDGTIKLGEAGVPVLILPMPISGMTSPMSLFSTIIQNNAEVLACMAFLQTAHPGRPVLYGSAPGTLDMSNGLFSVASPEGVLQNAACAQMAKKYGIPNKICLGGADAQAPGIQAAVERAIGFLPGFLSGSDMVCGVGLTGTAQYLYKEELILGEDIIGFCRRIAQGVRAGEEHALTDVAIEVGHGGEFLTEESTLEYLRNGEFYLPKVFPRESPETWANSPKKDIMVYAASRVEEILSKPCKDNYTDGQYKRLMGILAKADAELKN